MKIGQIEILLRVIFTKMCEVGKPQSTVQQPQDQKQQDILIASSAEGGRGSGHQDPQGQGMQTQETNALASLSHFPLIHDRAPY